jgi:hypothetical protein
MSFAVKKKENVMPSVDDFIQRFGGAGSMDDREAQQYYDRFASTDPQHRDYDNDTLYEGATQHLGQLPDDQFHHVSQQAFEQAPPQQRAGLIQTLLGGLQGRGVNPMSVGLRSTDPNSMSGSDFSRLADYARRNHPDVMRQTVQQQPWLVKAMGSPILMGALGVVAANMMRKRRV